MRFAAVLGLCALLSPFAPAQTTLAVISGTVKDSSGATIPNAAVVATNVNTGVRTSTATNEVGSYIFPALQPGLYAVSAEAQGFRKAVVQNIDAAVSARISVDLALEVGALTEVVEIEASFAAIETVGNSIGNVVSMQRIQDLPLAARDAAALISLQAGVVGDNFNGLRTMSQNVTYEGINIQETRYNGGYSSGNLSTFNSVDKIAEFRVITSPADAEYGRGSAQVQMIGRSGSNRFSGSVFEFNRVTALSANTWSNNRLGQQPDGTPNQPRNFLIRNQFGARIGGPVILPKYNGRNKTFFFFLYEGQRQLTKNTVNSVVYTEAARRGIFRYYPGVRNANAQAQVPTVDHSGNPVRPATATGDLQSVSLFGRDPNRMTPDPTGLIEKALLGIIALPNNYLLGDGLNTAGHLWKMRETADNDMYSLRIDQNFSEKHRGFFSMNKELFDSFNGFRGQIFPGANPDAYQTFTNFYAAGLTSTLSSTLLNELRAGVNRFKASYVSAWDNPPGTLPQIKGQPFFFTTAALPTDAYTQNWAPQGRLSPVYQFSDTVSWLRGKHAFKGGVEVRFSSSNGFNSFYVTPGVTLGAAAAAPVQNINTLQGIGNNATLAQNILNDLSGSVSRWTQQFNSPGGKDPQFLPGEMNQRTWRQREYSWFFKDDWKVRPDLTLNLGVRYEYYSVPFEANGKAAIPVNGSAGIFGLSGSDWSAYNRPGATGGILTQMMLIGPRSPNPDKQPYHSDLNNFAPAVGFTWSLPWFGKDKTVFRAGYGVSYDRNMLRNLDTVVGEGAPGITQRRAILMTQYTNLASLAVPYGPVGKPLEVVPTTDRTQTVRAFDSNLRTPYTQNWNASLQRMLTKDLLLTVRYVGTKGTKLFRSTNVNDVNIFENGFLDAYLTTQRGGNAPLFDRMFMGGNVPGRGVVDGRTVFGSDYVRSNSTFQGFLANNTVGGMALNFNSSNLLTATNGGLLTRAGLPENFFVTNPQFSSAFLLGNYANSTYNSLQVEVEKRFAQGFMFQTNYTWSKALGEDEGDINQYYEITYRSGRNRSIDKRLLSWDRRHYWKGNGTWELPFGRNRLLFRNANRVLDSVIGGWKASGIFILRTGAPFSINAAYATFNRDGQLNTADSPVKLTSEMVRMSWDGNGPRFFGGWTQQPDPRRSLIADPLIRSLSGLFAIYNEKGDLMFQNPLPGTLGNLGRSIFTMPSVFNTDLALAKTVSITERWNVEVRADFINATNTPYFTGITNSIASTDFGRLGYGGGNRIVVLGGRLNF